MKTNLPGAAAVIAASLSFFFAGCTVHIGSSNKSSSGLEVRGGETSTLVIEVAEWDVPVADPSPIHANWKTTGKWLEKTSDPAASNLWVQLRFRGRTSSGAELDYTMHGLRATEFQTMHPEGIDPARVHLTAHLSTARLDLRGERDRSQAGGELQIVPDPAFLQEGGRMLKGDPTLNQLIRFGLQPNPLEYIRLVATHGSDWTWNEVLQLRLRGVNPDYIHALRRPRARAAETELAASRADRPGRDLFTADDLVLLHSRGVKIDYIEKVDASGTSYSAQDLVLLHSRGVSANFVEEVLKSMPGPAASELVLLNNRGVSASYIRELRGAGYDFGANDLVLLHSRGVSVDYARNVKRAGYDYSSADLVLLNSRGVSANYLSSIAQPQYQALSAAEVLRLYTSGVPPEMVQRLRKQ